MITPHGMLPPNWKRTKVIACATVIEEMLPLMPAGMTYETLEYGLHLAPKNLKEALQNAIDSSYPDYDVVILGYGLCSMAVIGLEARNCTLVVPKVDDCIAIFLGSGETYNEMSRREPGTYYLTKGWIEVGDTILEEYQRAVKRFGEERATRIMGQMFKHYTRVVYIDTGHADQEQHREHAQQTANQFNLRYEEIEGSNAIIHKMLFGPWDSDFVVVMPGHSINYMAFKTPEDVASRSD